MLCPCSPHIFIIAPHRSPLLLLLCPYIIIVVLALIILWPLSLLYIERRSCHLYHPRIIHLCNVKEVSPSNRLNSKVFIFLFYLLLSWFHNILNLALCALIMNNTIKVVLIGSLHGDHNQQINIWTPKNNSTYKKWKYIWLYFINKIFENDMICKLLWIFHYAYCHNISHKNILKSLVWGLISIHFIFVNYYFLLMHVIDKLWKIENK